MAGRCRPAASRHPSGRNRSTSRGRCGASPSTTPRSTAEPCSSCCWGRRCSPPPLTRRRQVLSNASRRSPARTARRCRCSRDPRRCSRGARADTRPVALTGRTLFETGRALQDREDRGQPGVRAARVDLPHRDRGAGAGAAAARPDGGGRAAAARVESRSARGPAARCADRGGATSARRAAARGRRVVVRDRAGRRTAAADGRRPARSRPRPGRHGGDDAGDRGGDLGAVDATRTGCDSWSSPEQALYETLVRRRRRADLRAVTRRSQVSRSRRQLVLGIASGGSRQGDPFG